MTEFCVTSVKKIPSVNHYVRHAQGRHFKSPEARYFEREVELSIFGMDECPRITKTLEIEFFLATCFGRRDLDNLCKLFIDCLARHYKFNDAKIEQLILKKIKLVGNNGYEIIRWRFL